MIHKGGSIDHMTPHRLNQNNTIPLPNQLILRGSQTAYNCKHECHDSCTLSKGSTLYPREVISSLAKWLYDVDINTSDTSTPTHNQISGPITRAHARQLNNKVSSFLASYSSYIDNGNVCSILLLRNDGQKQNRVAFALATLGFQNSSSLWRPPWPRMDLDSGVQILSGKLLESTFICIKPHVHIMSEPAEIIILMQRPFSANGAATPYFGPLGRVSCWVQFECILGLEYDPASLRSSSHTYKT
jgi:hypothetical protein